jgi:hypothetical protein
LFLIAREEFPRVFQDTQATCAGNEIHMVRATEDAAHAPSAAAIANTFSKVLMSRANFMHKIVHSCEPPEKF